MTKVADWALRSPRDPVSIQALIGDFAKALKYRVFDRLRQSDTSSARRRGGLGLALIKCLVELHGGTIEAASAGEGQGATFKVTLPVRAVATPIGEAEGAPVVVKSSGELASVRAPVNAFSVTSIATFRLSLRTEAQYHPLHDTATLHS